MLFEIEAAYDIFHTVFTEGGYRDAHEVVSANEGEPYRAEHKSEVISRELISVEFTSVDCDLLVRELDIRVAEFLSRVLERFELRLDNGSNVELQLL